MTPNELEQWAKKILKLIQVNEMAVRCCYKTMPIVQWNSWKGDNNESIVTAQQQPQPQQQNNHNCSWVETK